MLTWLTRGQLRPAAARACRWWRSTAAGSPGARALVRTVLLCLAVPPLIWDRDRRGLHDRAADTAVVNVS